MATDWLINQDIREVCPNNPKIVQRWELAVTSFSAGCNEWLKCGALGIDPCGFEPHQAQRMSVVGKSLVIATVM
jgi:hypothetical protein